MIAYDLNLKMDDNRYIQGNHNGLVLARSIQILNNSNLGLYQDIPRQIHHLRGNLGRIDGRI